MNEVFRSRYTDITCYIETNNSCSIFAKPKCDLFYNKPRVVAKRGGGGVVEWLIKHDCLTWVMQPKTHRMASSKGQITQMLHGY